MDLLISELQNISDLMMSIENSIVYIKFADFGGSPDDNIFKVIDDIFLLLDGFGIVHTNLQYELNGYWSFKFKVSKKYMDIEHNSKIKLNSAYGVFSQKFNIAWEGIN